MAAVASRLSRSKAKSAVGEAEAALTRLGMPISPVHITQRTPLETSLNAGRGITESHPSSPGADDIRKLWTYLDELTAAQKTKRRA